jgi:hypothetical protein
MKRLISVTAMIAGFAWSGQALLAFCGFYVAKADTKIFNKASQVVLVRPEDRTACRTTSRAIPGSSRW